MRKTIIRAMRRTASIAAIGSLAAGMMLSGANLAVAADMPVDDGPATNICGQNIDDVVLFDAKGRPTIPARTPFFYCVTGETLLPGQIPPPPEYCCR